MAVAMKSSAKLDSELGAALNEFAMVLVLLLLFMMGIADFTQLFISNSRIDSIVREVGRKAALLHDRDCVTEATTNIETALVAQGFNIHGIPTGSYSSANPLKIPQMVIVLNVQNNLLTQTLSLIGMTQEPVSVRTYTFPVEHPDVCK